MHRPRVCKESPARFRSPGSAGHLPETDTHSCRCWKRGGRSSKRTLQRIKNNARLVVLVFEVLAFPLDTNDVVNSLETMERKIKEFETHASINIPEFVKVGIVIRQTE